MTRFFEKFGWLVCLLTVVFCAGCETTDYEPLIMNKKLKEMQAEIEALKAEVEALKKAGVASIAVEGAAPAPLATVEVTKSAADEKQIRDELEDADAYFQLDDLGYAIEADLTECRTPNDVLAKLIEFPKLTKVLMDGTQTDPSTFDSLAKIAGLEHLEIERSSPDAASLEKLKSLKNLKYLQLFKATLTPEGMKVISEYPQLEQIRCGQTRVGDEELSYLSNLKTLKAIDLSDCNRVTIAGLESLSQCPKLAFLKVWGPSIDNEGMKHVAKMKSLNVLGLNDTRVDDDGIKLLADLDLTELHLFRTTVGDEGLKVLSEMPNIVSLNLRDTRLSDQGIAHLSKLKKLKKLDLSECNSPGITNAAGASFSKMASLNQLNLWSTSITDSGVEQLAGLSNLTWLNLDNTKITDDGVAMLAKMPQLTWLHLGKTAVTDREIKVLLSLVNLKYLNISYTKISEDGFYQLDDFFSPKGCKIIAP